LPHDIADSDANPLHDDMVRRRLLLAIFPLIQNPDSSIGLLIRHHGRGPQLIGQEDVPWLLDLGLNSEFPTTTWTLARLLQSLYNPTQTPDLANRILEACEINPVMRRALRSLWRPVSLSSRQARSAHESREFWVQMEAERRRSVPDPPPKERVAAALGEIEAGETIAFVRLLHDLGWSANGEYDYQEPLDLRVLPGWSEADPPTQARIVDAVCAYLESGDPEYERLIATDYALPSTRAAIRALYLRDALEREERRDLPQPDWYRWAPAMLPRFNLHEDDKHDWISDTLRRAYEQQPRRVLDTIERLLAIDLDGGQWVPTAHGLDAIWDQAITKIIDKACRVAAEQGLARPFQALFEQLARNAPDLAVGLGGDLMRRTADTAGSEPAKIGVIVAHALINQRMEVAWPAIWQTVQGNSEFARGLVLALAEDSQREADWWFWLPTPALGDLARSVEYGFFADASRHEASFRLEVLRNGLIAALVERGEPEAVAAMEGIVAVCPDTPWLRLRLVHARESLRRVAWCPPSPAELLETIWDTRKRLVRNDDELLSVIIESLARLHERLHGWNGLVRALWNEGASPKPKEEDFLSDFVRDHLEQDLPGIIAHREVQVRRLKPRGGGERTDILVVAQTADARVRQATASVVIETKGCWHKEIHTAMEHQLKERYLIDSGHCRGLYLVGWYQPADKTSGQRQCSSFSKKALEETRLQLEDQAASLSVGEIRIRVFVLDARLPT